MNQSAETYALKVLTWLIGHDELRPIFMGTSGIDEETFKRNATTPELLSAVLEFVMMDDEWVLSCCNEMALDPHEMNSARQNLPGGAQIHWT